VSDSDRLQLLEDREEIRQIFTDYAKYLDSHDHAGYASLFARDGVLSAQLGEAVGPAAIEKILDDSLGPQVRGHLPDAIHVMTNHQIDVDGDTATAKVVWYYLTTDADGSPVVLQSGRYDDDVVREDGRWKLKRHIISRAMGRSPMDPAPATRLDELAARVQAIEDKDGVWRLLMEYRRHLDSRDFKAYASLFTDDGMWAGDLGKAVGPAAIEDLLVRTLEVYESDTTRTYHVVSNPVIDVDGDRATAYTNWTFVTRAGNDMPVWEMLGHYVDEIVRTPEGWKFKRRVAYRDMPYVSLEGVL
jgi:ketosteroid isomerase-like protein